MAMPLWKATAVLDIGPTDNVLFDTCLISHLYSKRLDGDRRDSWVIWDATLTQPARVWNEVVRWELQRAKNGDDWIGWGRDHFRNEELDDKALKEFRRLLNHVLQPGAAFGGAADGLVAAHARAHGLVLATRNVKDFLNIPGLRLKVPP